MSDENLVWCIKQKRGIRIIEPNPNLAKAYLQKAISALNTMTAAAKINETDWILTTAYYARYFALYALLTKIGVKSEIHDCTINIAKLLVNNGILNNALVQDLTKAKQLELTPNIMFRLNSQLEQLKPILRRHAGLCWKQRKP